MFSLSLLLELELLLELTTGLAITCCSVSGLGSEDCTCRTPLALVLLPADKPLYLARALSGYTRFCGGDFVYRMHFLTKASISRCLRAGSVCKSNVRPEPFLSAEE